MCGLKPISIVLMSHVDSYRGLELWSQVTVVEGKYRDADKCVNT